MGLVGIGGEQRGHVGDGGIVAASEVLRCVGDRWREQAAEGVDDLVVGVPGELEGGVGWLGCGVHGGDMVLVWLSVNVSFASGSGSRWPVAALLAGSDCNSVLSASRSGRAGRGAKNSATAINGPISCWQRNRWFWIRTARGGNHG